MMSWTHALHANIHLTMKRIVWCSILIPALAFAEKQYETETDIAHDCAKEPVVQVNAAAAKATFTGTCTKIELNGAGITATIENSITIEVNGASSKANIGGVDRLEVNGMGNAVTYKKAVKAKKTRVYNNGLNNKIAKAK